MRKLLSFVLVLILSLRVLPTLVACGDTEPAYSEEYVFNDTHHWKPQINGDGEPIEYEEHYNPKSDTAVGRCKCGYYFPCHNLVYEKTKVNGRTGYAVVDYDEDMSPNFYHVEIPKYHQEQGDSQPLPVLSVGEYALSNDNSNGKCDIRLESIKFNEGLINLGKGVISYSNIEEITIPNSVVGVLSYTFRGCTSLKKIVIGNGVTGIGGYTFQNVVNCHTVVFGNSITEIRPRTFRNCNELKTIVLPASLVSMPEGSIADNAVGCAPQTVIFPGSGRNIFFQITREELQERTIPVFQRDANGNLLDKDGNIAHEVIYKDGEYIQQSYTTYGLNANWYGLNTVYCLGEWEYDENNVPQPK